MRGEKVPGTGFQAMNVAAASLRGRTNRRQSPSTTHASDFTPVFQARPPGRGPAAAFALRFVSRGGGVGKTLENKTVAIRTQRPTARGVAPIQTHAVHENVRRDRWGLADALVGVAEGGGDLSR